MDERQHAINRRRFIECFSAAGLGSTLLPGALAAVARDAATITIDMLQDAQRIAGVSFTPDEQRRLLEKLNGARGYVAGFERLREAGLGNSAQPAIVFNPVPPGKQLPTERHPLRRQKIDVPMPRSDEQLAFLPLTYLSRLVESRHITPTELTKLYLVRLKKFDPQLHCVVNLTEELALRQARQADQEIAAGTYRGPLHGIPFGLKDLLAVRGVKTTWGMSPYEDRVIDTDATVYSRLTKAGGRETTDRDSRVATVPVVVVASVTQPSCVMTTEALTFAADEPKPDASPAEGVSAPGASSDPTAGV